MEQPSEPILPPLDPDRLRLVLSVSVRSGEMVDDYMVIGDIGEPLTQQRLEHPVYMLSRHVGDMLRATGIQLPDFSEEDLRKN